MGSARPAIEVACPKCGTNVLETGWTVHQVVSASYMRFTGRGAVFIAGSMYESEEATCMCCDAKLGMTAAGMVRAAGDG